jgi:HD superfamily phosphohydrolase
VLSSNKLKVFNDPIYGSVAIPSPLILQVISHPFFQRLRRISQMGLSYLVYPGAHHTRFHHALGAMNLMQRAIDTLTLKGVSISAEERQGLLLAILLHDIGHGPFSHALEEQLISKHHESLSLGFMELLNEEFEGQLDMAIAIFKGESDRPFLNQLVSSQLDMDRLDYLKRDSFFAGVTEGNINSERLISTINVVNDSLVIEEKGIYSVEKFLMARRFMYWQVYLHKTSVVAEIMLGNIIERAKELIDRGVPIEGPPNLMYFLNQQYSKNSEKEITLYQFAAIDDIDIMACIKRWSSHSDTILARLCNGILNRDLLEVRFREERASEKELEVLKTEVAKEYNVSLNDAHYLVYDGTLWNLAYNPNKQPIRILFRGGEVMDFMQASRYAGAGAFSVKHEKNYICSPKLQLP